MSLALTKTLYMKPFTTVQTFTSNILPQRSNHTRATVQIHTHTAGSHTTMLMSSSLLFLTAMITKHFAVTWYPETMTRTELTTRSKPPLWKQVHADSTWSGHACKGGGVPPGGWVSDPAGVLAGVGVCSSPGGPAWKGGGFLHGKDNDICPSRS